MLRFPEGMRERIKRSADVNGRSMNAEIVAVLAEHYPEPPDAFEALVQDVLDVLAQADAPSTAKEEGQQEPMGGRNALADLLDRVKQEVERRRS